MYIIGTAIIHVCGFSFAFASNKGAVRLFDIAKVSISDISEG
jgi:hypothetical protein